MTSNLADGRTPPIFILSNPRSGSTLLRYVIDTHPDICCPPELNLLQLCNGLFHANYYTIGQVSACANGAERNQMIRQRVRQIVFDMMEAYARAKNKKIWCEKSPENLRHLDLITDIFPDAKFICLHRHCLDTVHSLLEMSKHGVMESLVRYIHKDPQHFVSVMMESWVDGTNQLLEFEQKYGSQCFRILYEDIVTEPVKTLETLFTFLGVEWDPTLLDSVFSTSHDMGQGDIKIHFSKKLSQDNIGKGMTIANKPFPASLVKQVNALLEGLSYPPLGSDWRRQPAIESETDKVLQSNETKFDIAEIFTKRFPQRLRERKNRRPQEINTVYKFIVTGAEGGVWLIDLTGEDDRIIPGDGVAGCEITVSSNDLVHIVDGRLNAAEALIQDRIRVTGNLQQANRIGQLLFEKV